MAQSPRPRRGCSAETRLAGPWAAACTRGGSSGGSREEGRVWVWKGHKSCASGPFARRGEAHHVGAHHVHAMRLGVDGKRVGTLRRWVSPAAGGGFTEQNSRETKLFFLNLAGAKVEGQEGAHGCSPGSGGPLAEGAYGIINAKRSGVGGAPPQALACVERGREA